MDKIDIKSLSLDEISDYLKEKGEPKFRAKQIFAWLHNFKVTSFSQMTNISKKLIQMLDNDCYITTFEVERKLVSQLDGTTKYLYKLQDNNFIESVVMDYKHGKSVCISTQVGCKMGCKFCASTIAGFVRNLTASEMLEQVYFASRDSGVRISNIVLMGIGEPLDNYDNVMRFLHLVSHEEGNNLSLRHVSLSTCGIVPKIQMLAKEKLGVTLSVSLHAPNDTIRSQTMPINDAYNVDTLLKACKEYAQQTHRRISYEYALIDGVNDSMQCAKELGSRLKGSLCHVNLIPVNQVKETGFKTAKKQNIQRFIQILEGYGITTTVRRTLGADINAACGQLRRENTQRGES
ncbi:MAG: 23S rRNA (adenine(2503)-C(2))-methyltransferase RlmN [Oscillospiraceae bacterium]|nr:23S rRNA (adenine(2503)-C(2))-methyltransferase RlmN [Oscillospiraceae bacterium]